KESSWQGLRVSATSSNNQEEEWEHEPFQEEAYDGWLKEIGEYLSTLQRQEEWNNKHFKEVRRRAYGFLLKDGVL
ncbi:hypothetical protein, partial [Proteus vulgaris]|uniref:hypothetical protein n=1 Tax=Proteus vulgaris TaxID=585 RepID=UPI002554FAD8